MHMKKNKQYKIFKTIFMIFFFSYSVIYFSELAGYYEYQNYKKTALTEEQIKKFEQDVKGGKQVDISDYIVKNNVTYQNRLSRLTSKLSDGISNIVKSSVEETFKFLSKMIDYQ